VVAPIPGLVVKSLEPKTEGSLLASTEIDPQRSRWLRRADQATVAVLVAASLVAVVLWWGVHGGWQGRLIEWDRSQAQTARFQVDVNSADWPELAQLPGIGPVLAQRIVEVRKASGPFKELDDLRRVKGIGAITLKRLAPYLCPLAAPSASAPRDESQP
jgi:competence protein ComEA